MKKYFLISLTLLISLFTYSQDFAPIGAEWYYTEVFAFSNDTSYLYVKAEKDTIIGNTAARVLSADYLCGYPSNEVIIHYNQDKELFIYDDVIDSFVLIMDFNANENDSIKFNRISNIDTTLVDNIRLRIDSFETVNINNTPLKKFYVNYRVKENSHINPYAYSYNSIIYETIGDVNYLFYFPDYPIFCDMNFPAGLRCYSDSIIGSYSTNIASECNYTNTGIKDLNSDNEVSIYPNPTSSIIKIETKNPFINYLQIYSVSGNLMIEENFIKSTTLDISNFSKGIYIIKFIDSDKNIIYKKIIKR